MTEHDIDDLGFLRTMLALVGGRSEMVQRHVSTLDTERLADKCQRHQVAGLAYLLFDELPAHVTVPEGLLNRLRAPYLEQWARTERLRLHLAQLASMLREEGEEFLLLKGLSVSARFYGRSDCRATGDLDILVPRARAHRIADVLERRGLTRRSPRYRANASALDHVHHVEFDYEGDAVELHHGLRVHPSFRIDEDRLWSECGSVQIQGDTYATLSDEHALLLHLLGLHSDVHIGTATGRWFVDAYQMLTGLGSTFPWNDFLEARRADGTGTICINSLALFLVLTRSDEHFSTLSTALDRRRDQIVLEPDRLAYLDLLRGTSMLTRKTWSLRQYEGGMPRTVSWWLSGIPQRIAAKPEAFTEDVIAHTRTSPWEESPRARVGSTIEDEFGVDPSAFQRTVLRFGSLTARVYYQRASYLDAVEELFRLRPGGARDAVHSGNGTNTVDAIMYIFDGDRDRLSLHALPDRPVVDRPLERLVEIQQGVAHGWIYRGKSPVELYIAIDREHETPTLLLHSLMVVINKILSHQDRYHLHAAAVALNHKTSLFVGGKGAGKSTISLGLGRAGGTVLSEDHVMLRRADGRFLVSGCDSKMHLTEKSERHFFDLPLEARVVQSAGVPKKQVDMVGMVDCRPYEERQVAALFFCEVGDQFAIRSLSKEEASARLLEPLTERHRFVDPAEQQSFVALFCQLAESCPTWALTLSPNIADLSRLATFVREANAEAAAPEILNLR